MEVGADRPAAAEPASAASAGGVAPIEWPALAVVVLVPLVFSVKLDNAAEPKLSVLTFMLGAALIAWGLWGCRGFGALITAPIVLLGLARLGWGLLTKVTATNPGLGRLHIATQGAFLGVFCLVGLAAGTVTARRRLHVALMCVSAPIAVYGILQYFGADPVSWASPNEAFSTLGNRNFAGEFLVGVIPLALVGTIGAGELGRKPYGILTALLLVHLGLTFTRGAWVGAAAGLVVLLLLLRRDRVRRSERLRVRAGHWIVGALLALAAALALLLTQPGRAVAGRATSLRGWKGESVRIRLDAYRVASRLFAANPVLGVGAGNFRIEYPPYKGEVVARAEVRRGARLGEAHNDYLETLAETGAPGFLLLLAVVVLAVRTLVRAGALVEDRRDRLLAAGAAAGMCGMLVHAMLSFPLQNTASACLWWTLAGLGWGMLHREKGVVAGSRALPVVLCATAGAYLIWLSPSATVYSRAVRVGEGYTVYGQGARTEGRAADAGTYLAKAEESLGRAINLRPYSPKPHFLLSTALALAGRYEEAEEIARLHLELDPYSREGWHNLGRMFEEQNRLEEAVDGYATAVEINPYDPAERTALGIALGKLGRHEEAAEELQAAVELSEGDADAWANLGVALHAAGRDAEAVEAWREAADLYGEAGRRREEMLQWRRILALDPQDGQARGRLGG